jgi:AraC-like DNA-binding protein
MMPACAEIRFGARLLDRHNISLMRQVIVRENDPRRGVSISTLAHEYSRGSRVPLHAHGSDQLIYASRGIMEVASGQCLWLIPPHFGLWIPARTPHRIRMPESVSMRTLYLRPGLVDFRQACTVLHAGPLLRELIFEIVRIGRLRIRNRVECALRDVLIAELKRSSSVPTMVMLPNDRRALTVAQAVIGNPALRLPLTSLCASAGVSVRTLERAFRKEAGIDFESWRRQVRLMKAVELLVSGCSVKEVSFAVGYQQPSAFVALFRATFGTTPKAWISALERL